MADQTTKHQFWVELLMSGSADIFSMLMPMMIALPGISTMPYLALATSRVLKYGVLGSGFTMHPNEGNNETRSL